MLRSRWGGILMLVFLIGLVGCKCGKKPEPTDSSTAGPDYESTVSGLPGAGMVDVARLIPADVDLAVFAEHPDKVYKWLEARDWWQGVRKSPVWADLLLAGPMKELSTARFTLASMSPVEMKLPKLEEFLTTPMGIAAERTAEGWRILMVKQIDLRVQAMDRLAEVFNQVRDDSRMLTTEKDGIKIRTFDLGEGSSLCYALYSNLLILANDEEMLLKSVGLAAGKDKNSLVSANSNTGLFEDNSNADLVIYADPAGINRWLYRLLPLQAVSLMWRLGDPPSASVAGVVSKEEAREGRAGTVENLEAMIPLESMLVIGHGRLELEELWKKISSAFPETDEEAEEAEVPDLANKLLARLTGEAVLVVTGFDVPVPEAALLLRIKDAKDLEETLAGTIALFFGSKPEKETLSDLGDKHIWSSGDGEVSPAFAFHQGWLVAGTSRDAVHSVLATASGKSPSIGDRVGFKDKVLAVADPFYGLSYLDCERLFEAVEKTTRELMFSSELFDSNDVDDTLSPLFDALKKIGRLGYGLSQKNERVVGSVVAL